MDHDEVQGNHQPKIALLSLIGPQDILRRLETDLRSGHYNLPAPTIFPGGRQHARGHVARQASLMLLRRATVRRTPLEPPETPDPDPASADDLDRPPPLTYRPHHLLAVPSPRWRGFGNPLDQGRSERAQYGKNDPWYLLPETPADLPLMLGNLLRHETELICPPEWDRNLTRVCHRAGMLRRLTSWRCRAYRLKPEIDRLQQTVSDAIRSGKLRFDHSPAPA